MNIFKKIILNAYIPLLVLAGLSCSGTSDGGTISVQSVTIDDKSTQTVTMGKTLQLSATVLPDDASNKEVTWSSSDTSVATVDGSGQVRPVSVGGPVTITVTSKADATKSDTIEISTTPGGTISVQSVTIDDKSTQTVTMGKTLQLSATVLPDDASNKEVTWSSGDTNVATVDGSGQVRPVSVGGPVTITVTSKADATKSDTIEISTTPASSEASITALKVTIGTTDYTVSFDGTIGTVVIPNSDDIPTRFNS